MRGATRVVIMIAAVAGAGSAKATDGATLFVRNCALCHQSDASGLPGQFPRLAGRIGHISGKPQGRVYLIDVLTYGMAGQITVDKQPIIGAMPALPLTDDDAAQELSYLTALGNAHPTLFTAEEVAGARAKPRKSSSEVHAERQTLLSAKVID
jgi:mono/diheme cytochrome c family protein